MSNRDDRLILLAIVLLLYAALRPTGPVAHDVGRAFVSDNGSRAQAEQLVDALTDVASILANDAVSARPRITWPNQVEAELAERTGGLGRSLPATDAELGALLAKTIPPDRELSRSDLDNAARAVQAAADQLKAYL